jgi:hypothetical protein
MSSELAPVRTTLELVWLSDDKKFVAEINCHSGTKAHPHGGDMPVQLAVAK